MKYNKIISKSLILGISIASIPLNSFATQLNFEDNKYAQEINNIETIYDLQKSAQNAFKSNELGTWIEGLTNMPTKRYTFSSAVIDNKIYCIGGATNSGSPSKKVEVYDPATDTWETKKDMPSYRKEMATAVVDGKIYLIGGFLSSSYSNLVEVYDPATDTWETKTSMPTSRVGLTSAVVDGKIYAIGGSDLSANKNIVEVYDPKTDTWQTKARMITGRTNLTSEVIDGKIYCIGGNSSYREDIVEVYDPSTNTWQSKASMPTARDYLTSSVLGGKIYCIGGYDRNSSRLNTVEVYDPSTNTWESAASMPTARRALESQVVNGKIYCIGGSVDVGDYSDIVEAYTLGNSSSDTGNSDVQIETENALSISLNTNSVTFKKFSGLEDVEKTNAIILTVESSLPYDVSVSLESEIQNTDGPEIIDKSALKIKANVKNDYNTFTSIGTPVLLLETQNAGKVNTHGIDLKLSKTTIPKTGVYKTILKFEAIQK